MPHLSGGRWVGEASASPSKGRPAYAETLRAGRLKSPLPRLSEGLREVIPHFFCKEDGFGHLLHHLPTVHV